MPPGANMSLLEQRKKRHFGKYHNFLGHKVSQYFLFEDLVQNIIKDGSLKFIDKRKAQMKIDADPLHVGDSYYTEPDEVCMLEATEGLNGGVDMTKITEDLGAEIHKIEIVENLNVGVNMVEINEEIDIKEDGEINR